MRAYITVTGILFASLVVIHIWRAILEGTPIARDPAVAISTLLGVGMCGWAVTLLRRPKS